jgi:ATP-binding cassette subfamily C protein
MMVYSRELTLAAGLISLTMTLSTVALLPQLAHKIRNVMVLEAENQGVLVESFKGAMTLKTTTAHRQFWDEFQGRFSRHANQMLNTTQISILNNTFSQVVSDIGMIGLLWYGSRFVITGELSIGQLLAFNSMNQNFLALITMLIKFVDEFAKVKTATERLIEVVDATPENFGDEKKAFIPLPDDGDINCSNLTYNYPGRLNLLDNFSLVIPGGKVIALIGNSGCGKSTLAKFISGLHSVRDGNIRIGQYNIQDLSLDCLRQQVVLVPQEAHFWNRTVIENFRLGNPAASFDQIIQACQIADADGFISNLPNKYQTVLGEFGANISGGQRQRLAIARGIINNPPILILDESTAGLDPVSESLVLDQLLVHRQGKTTILISHRPRVINRADWIVLIDKGKLVIQGSPSQLASIPGDHLEFLFESPEQVRKAKIDAYLQRGQQLFNNGDGLGAISDYNQVMELDPKCARALCCRGIARLALQENQKALKDFDTAIEISPSFANAYLWRGISNRRLKNKLAASEDLKKAASLFRKQSNKSGYNRALQMLRELRFNAIDTSNSNKKSL